MYEEEDIEPEILKRPKTNPFRTPDYYFETMEDRIMGNIEYQTKKQIPSSKVFQLLKPVLGLAASFALIYLLVYYPITTFVLKDTAKTEITDSVASDWLDEYSFSLVSIDENALVNVLFSDETTTIAQTNPDEVLAYLSSGMNDLAIYSEIQN